MQEPNISLKEHFDRRFEDMKESVKTAYNSMEKRLEGMNEFRSQLKDQTARFVTRDEMAAKHDGLERQITDLQLSKAKLEGKASQQSVNIAFVISVIGMLIGIIGIVLKFI